MIRADARLRVVLVNYNGGALLQRAVRSALDSQWPGEIDVVVVDNDSSDGSAAEVETLPGVHVIYRLANEGFGANNHGLADLVGGELEIDLPPAGVVALLNPDAAVRPETFRLLAAQLDEDKKVGAASPLIVFDRPFIELDVVGNDITIDSVSDGVDELSSRCHGTNGAERLPGEHAPLWLCPPGSQLRVPVDGLGHLVVGVASGVGTVAGQQVEGPCEISVGVAAHQTVQVVQNAGVGIGARGVGYSRGSGHVVGNDLGAPVDLWCGAAVVFHPAYLSAIGGFDPEYFLYYEDVDLGLRGLAAGWKTVHVPEAIVEHRHSDRTLQGSELVEVLQHRNRLLTIVRHGTPAEVASGFALAAMTPLSLAVSAARNPDQRAERLRLAKWRAKSLKEAVQGVGYAVGIRNQERDRS